MLRCWALVPNCSTVWTNGNCAVALSSKHLRCRSEIGRSPSSALLERVKRFRFGRWSESSSAGARSEKLRHKPDASTPSSAFSCAIDAFATCWTGLFSERSEPHEVHDAAHGGKVGVTRIHRALLGRSCLGGRSNAGRGG